MLVASFALLQQNPQPTEAEIRAALSGNYCRCTGYKKIVEAVLKAAARPLPADVTA
jgi:carbon-monoxide dehydrogenase small subunit